MMRRCLAISFGGQASEEHLCLIGSSVRLSAISRKSGASAIDIDRTGPQQTNDLRPMGQPGFQYRISISSSVATGA